MARLTEHERMRFAERLRVVMTKDHLKQSALAQACQVDQGLVSRILSKQIVRHTRRTKRVEKYVNMRMSRQRVPADVTNELHAFFAAGGEVLVLRDALRVLTR